MLSQTHKAVELVRELKRGTSDGSLPPFNEDGVRVVKQDIKNLFEKNREDAEAIVNSDTPNPSLLIAVHCRHAALERNKRCLLAYAHARLMHIKSLRWQFGRILPPEIASSLSAVERNWFTSYSANLAEYIDSLQIGYDFSSVYCAPPKSVNVQVRCLRDFGDFQTRDGQTVVLKKGTQHSLPRVDCEPLIRQGIMEHVDDFR